MTDLHEQGRERRRREAAAELGLTVDGSPLPARAPLDRAREAADIVDGYRDAAEVAATLAVVSTAEAAERTADALESIARSLALIVTHTIAVPNENGEPA